MKKVLFPLFAIVAIMLIVVSCKDKDNNNNVTPNTPTVESYFNVPGGNYVATSLPDPTTEEEPHVDMNPVAIPGGSSYVSVAYSTEASKILVGAEGAKGHYEIAPDNRGTNDIIYDFVMVMSQQLSGDLLIITIGVVDENGNVSEYVSVPVEIHVVGTGTLQVSLSFDNDKDVDLHLIEPNGYHIYYGDRESENGGELDLDSNPSCSIDGIDNENITYSGEAYVEPGVYTVYVDMWENCNPEVATNFVVTVIYEGEPLINAIAGTFPVGEPSNYANLDAIQPVCTFTIPENGQAKPAKSLKKGLPKFLRSQDK